MMFNNLQPEIFSDHNVLYPDFKDGFPKDTIYGKKSHWVISPEEIRPEIRVHPMKGRRKGTDALSNWYRIVISLPVLEAWTQFTKSFVLYATDEQANVIGTWERNPFNEDTQDCPPGSESKYMIIPCGGVTKYSPHVQRHNIIYNINSKPYLNFFLIIITKQYMNAIIFLSTGVKCYTVCT